MPIKRLCVTQVHATCYLSVANVFIYTSALFPGSFGNMGLSGRVSSKYSIIGSYKEIIIYIKTRFDSKMHSHYIFNINFFYIIVTD